MKRLLPILIAVLPLRAFAVEESFLGSTVTVSGTALASQPAGLAWQPPEWSLSASATSLQQTSQDVRSISGFRSANTPLKFVPVYIASGKGEGDYGWGMNLTSSTFSFRTIGIAENAGGSVKSDVFVQSEAVTATAGAGMKLGSQWSVGMSLSLRQTDVINGSKNRSVSAGGKVYTDTDETSRTIFGQASFGALFEGENWRLGLTANSASERVSHTGSRDVIVVDTQADLITESSQSVTPLAINTWDVTAGARLRLAEWGFLHVRDTYVTSGGHTPGAGLQVPSRWGMLTGSFSVAMNQVREYRLAAGLVRTSKTYDWGLGPTYTDTRGTTAGYINSRTLGLTFVSEIRF